MPRALHGGAGAVAAGGTSCKAITSFSHAAGSQSPNEHHPVHRRRGRHLVGEDLVPLRKHQWTSASRCGARSAAPELEQHFHLGPVLAHIADVIQQQASEAIEALQLAAQPQLALGRSAPGPGRTAWHGRCQFGPQRRHQVGLARGLQRCTLVASSRKRPSQSLGKCPRKLGQAGQLQRGQRFAARQAGFRAVPSAASSAR